MTVHVIDCIEEFKKIIETGTRYIVQIRKRTFLSWPWLQEYLPHRERWLILAWKTARRKTVRRVPAARAGDSQDDDTGLFVDEILMIGNHGTGRTGFLCAPGLESERRTHSPASSRPKTGQASDSTAAAGSARLERLLDGLSRGEFAASNTVDEGERIDACGRRLRSMLLRTLTGRNLRDCLNRRSLGIVLERAVALHAFGDFDGAEAGYRQLIRTVPGHIGRAVALRIS